MFNDYFHNADGEYLSKMNMAAKATQSRVACDAIQYECSDFGIVIVPTQDDGMLNQDTYFLQFYAQVRDSE